MGPTISSLIDNFAPELGQDSLEITRGPNSVNLRFNGRRNPISDTFHAVSTLDEDPGNHKRKALYSLAGVGAGIGAAGVAATRPGVLGALSRTAPSTSLLTLLGVAGPALAYYATRNSKDLRRAIPAALGSLGATVANTVLTKSPSTLFGIGNPSLAASSALTLGTAGAVGSFANMTDEFQKAEDLEHIKAIQEDPKLTPSQRKAMIAEIKSGRSMLQKYPITRYAPFADRANKIYSSAHGYNGAGDFIRGRIRE